GWRVMPVDWLLERMAGYQDTPAVVSAGQTASYPALLGMVDTWRGRLVEQGVRAGDVVALEADHSPQGCAALLAAFAERLIVAPMIRSVAGRREELLDCAHVRWLVSVDERGGWEACRRPVTAVHPLIEQLVARSAPGLVLFSS